MQMNRQTDMGKFKSILLREVPSLTIQETLWQPHYKDQTAGTKALSRQVAPVT